MDAVIFWGGCYLMPLAWGIILVSGILSLDLNAFTMSFINLALGVCNLLGYVKC